MIVYKRCSEIQEDLIYEAFKIGFSDYIIKLEMPKEVFFKRFFGPEGNSLGTSFVALDGDMPIGVILGAIKDYEGIKTIRCGTLAVHPKYRGQGISKKLHDLHIAEAIKAGCKQLFLEVIVGNDRAINFYKKLGYEKIYDLSYFSLEDLGKLSFKEIENIQFKEIEAHELRKVFENLKDTHINWQNQIDYIEKSEGQVTFGAYMSDILIGAASLNKNTRINFVWVNSAHRNNGIATNLILLCAKKLQLEKVSSGFPNNSSLQGYLRRRGFTKDNISQFEMYCSQF